MNLKQNTQYILSHPCFRYAIDQYSKGNTKEIELLLIDIQLHCLDIQAQNAAREYGNNKRMNSADIKAKIRDLHLPQNLSIELHVPIIEEEVCKVINLRDRVTIIKRKVVKYFNPLQLSLFEHYIMQAEA